MNYLAIILALVLAPLLPGVVNQTKAFFAGRKGPGYLRLYFDLAKLLRKSCPRSATTTWVFDMAPAAALASTLIAALLFPWSPLSGLAGTTSLALFFYLLAFGRVLTVLGALDTGSAFAGMGASREVQFAALAEPLIFTILGFVVLLTGTDTLAGLVSGYDQNLWTENSISLILIGVAFILFLLCECSRVPFDDPETHLELTMIHEAMILDNSGPDLAMILYGSALKFELFAAFLVAMLLPKFQDANLLWSLLLFVGIFALAIVVGIVESVMARMRFLKTPQILMGGIILTILATLLFILF